MVEKNLFRNIFGQFVDFDLNMRNNKKNKN